MSPALKDKKNRKTDIQELGGQGTFKKTALKENHAALPSGFCMPLSIK